MNRIHESELREIQTDGLDRMGKALVRAQSSASQGDVAMTTLHVGDALAAGMATVLVTLQDINFRLRLLEVIKIAEMGGVDGV